MIHRARGAGYSLQTINKTWPGIGVSLLKRVRHPRSPQEDRAESAWEKSRKLKLEL